MLNAIAGTAAIVLSIVAVLITLLWRAIGLIIEIARTALLIAIVALIALVLQLRRPLPRALASRRCQ
jgi:hypothetical protein